MRIARLSIVALFAALSLASCDDASSSKDAGAAITALPLSPIPAPEGLVAKIYIGTPDATWTKTRTQVGGPAALLPQTFAAFALTMTELPITLIGEIDAALPLVAAVVEAPGKEAPSAAIAIHVKSGENLATVLSKGEAARFTLTPDAATQITLLTPKDGLKPNRSLGIMGNTLLVARSIEELKAVGPYVARTMAAEAAPKEDIVVDFPESALAGPIAKSLHSMVGKLSEGRAAKAGALLLSTDFMPKLADMLPDLKGARMTLAIEGQMLHAKLSATPKPGGTAEKTIAALAAGDVTPLIEMPAATLAGGMVRLTAEQRTESAKSQAAAVARMLGPDLGDKDKEQIESAVRAVAEARGEWTAIGATFGATGPTGFARAVTPDAEKMGKALDDLIALTKVSSIKERLLKSDLAISGGKSAVENLPGDIKRIRFEHIEDKETQKDREKLKTPKPGKPLDPKGKPFAGGPDSAPPDTIDLYTLLTKDALFASAGYDSPAGLKAVLSAPTDKNLRSVPAIKGAFDALGDEAFFVVFADPTKIFAAMSGQPSASEPAPVVFAVERTKGASPVLYARLDVAVAAIQELIRRRGAL